MDKNTKLLKAGGWLGIVAGIMLLLAGEIFLALIFGCLAYFCLSKLKKGAGKNSSDGRGKTASAQPQRVVTSGQAQQHSSTKINNVSQTATHTPKPENKPVDQKFAQILAECFPEYSVKRNVDFASLTSEWWVCSCGAENTGKFCAECGKAKPVSTEWICKCGCRNRSKFCSDCGLPKPEPAEYEAIDFLLIRDGMPKLAILLVTRNRWNSKSIRSTIQACEEAGIPWQRYFEEFDNEVQYVTDRIRGDLR